MGLPDLAASLESRVSVTAGPSGVGKSSLINAINTQLSTAKPSDNGLLPPRKACLRSCCSRAFVQRQLLPICWGTDGKGGHEFAVAWYILQLWDVWCVVDWSALFTEWRHISFLFIRCYQKRQSQSCFCQAVQASEGHLSSAGSIDVSRNGSQNGAASPEAKLSDLAVGSVSQIGRGKHTTRNITLLPVAGGLLADTPGFNQPALEGVQPENLMSFFPEIQESIAE